MPCRSDYMEATKSEKNLSVIYGLLDELQTGKLHPKFGNGYDDRVYNKHFTKEHIDEKTKELCSKLQNTDVSKFSLEMQMWWRDHQKADKERVEEEIKDKATKQEKQKALNKLSDYERKLLGLS